MKEEKLKQEEELREWLNEQVYLEAVKTEQYATGHWLFKGNFSYTTRRNAQEVMKRAGPGSYRIVEKKRDLYSKTYDYKRATQKLIMEAETLSGRDCDRSQAKGRRPCGLCVKCLTNQIKKLQRERDSNA